MDFQRNDAMLMEILQERKTITGFLDAVFGFLRRNTDFYHTKTHADDKIGFEKGIREQVLYGAMQRYDPACYIQTTMATDVDANIDDDGELAPPAINEVCIEDITETEMETAPQITPAESEKKQTVLATNTFCPTDYKNGAKFENYCWAQTLKDIEVQLLLPEELKAAKYLKIDIKTDSITVSSKKQPTVVLLSGALFGRIKHNDAVWTIDDAKLLISCDKTRQVWWDKLFVHEPEIDIKKLDCERYLDEFPESTQAQIEKLRATQLKAHEQELQQAADIDVTTKDEKLAQLRKAWDIEGSPFKGQPFDPTLIKFS